MVALAATVMQTVVKGLGHHQEVLGLIIRGQVAAAEIQVLELTMVVQVQLFLN